MPAHVVCLKLYILCIDSWLRSNQSDSCLHYPSSLPPWKVRHNCRQTNKNRQAYSTLLSWKAQFRSMEGQTHLILGKKF